MSLNKVPTLICNKHSEFNPMMMIIFNASHHNGRFPAEAISAGGEKKKAKIYGQISCWFCATGVRPPLQAQGVGRRGGGG